MGVSSVGQSDYAGKLRYVLATLLVAVLVFYALYGPPITKKFRQAANQECNLLHGGSYRTYRLEWRSISFGTFDHPHWACWSVDEPDKVKDLGWWVGF